jgi:hypothetical protein
MSGKDGRRMWVPASRRLSCDLLYFNRRVPLCGHDLNADLSAVHEARKECAVRVSWPALFMKAYALVAREIPALRQTWHTFPWPHLYQHPDSTGVLTVQRSIHGEPWLFWGKIAGLEQLPLAVIQQRIDTFTSEECSIVFRKQLQMAQLPVLLRRLLWWWNLNVATRARSKRLGTFILSTLSGRGVSIQVPPSIHTGCLTYGPLDADNVSRITLAYDHRIMDGALVAEALQRLTQILNQEIAAELLQMQNTRAEPRAA